MKRTTSVRITVRRGSIAVVRHHSRYLLVQRAAGIPKAGMWCFPGGHVEPGETPRTAIVRELHEELGLSESARHRLGAVRTPDGAYVLAVWLFDYSGQPLQRCDAEIADTKWLTAAEIRNHPRGLPTNRHVLSLLATHLHRDA